jgi:hypothetical protein
MTTKRIHVERHCHHALANPVGIISLERIVEMIGRIETYDTRCSDCSRRGYDLAFIQELISYIKYRIPTALNCGQFASIFCKDFSGRSN